MQIRVHLADAGHAILGDEVYGVEVILYSNMLLLRQQSYIHGQAVAYM